MTIRKSHDVVIVGGGIFGLSCAYACVQRNMSVLVLDAGKIGGGASGGIVGAMAPYTPDQWHPKKQYQLEALISAQSHWANVDRLSGISSGYRRIGRLTPIVDERTYRLAELRHTEAQENWKDYTWDILDDDRMIADHTAPFGVIKDTLSARIFPDHACQSLAKACENLGVEFQENMRVTGFDENIVIGAFGEISAGAIILAGGYEGFHLLDYHYGTQMGKGVKGQAALLNINLGDMPQIYADGVYIVPHENGTTAVGSTSENTWGQPFSIDEKLDEVIAKARSICPTIKDAPILQTWAGLRPKARRRDPLLGKVAPSIFTAMGGFKIGFGLAHKIGYSLADCVQGIDPELPRSFTVEHHLE